MRGAIIWRWFLIYFTAMKAKHLIVAIVSVAGFAIGRAELRPSCLSMKEVYLGLMEKAVSAEVPGWSRRVISNPRIPACSPNSMDNFSS